MLTILFAGCLVLLSGWTGVWLGLFPGWLCLPLAEFDGWLARLAGWLTAWLSLWDSWLAACWLGLVTGRVCCLAGWAHWLVLMGGLACWLVLVVGLASPLLDGWLAASARWLCWLDIFPVTLS
jgi:hypothetical protein